METIQHLVPLVFAGSLFILVFAVGLDATLNDVLYMVRRPFRLFKAVVAVNIIVPVAAMIVVAALPISMVSKAAIILMAVSPAPPLVPGNELKVGGRKEYAYGLYVALIVLAVLVVPITVGIISEIYGVRLALSYGDVARNVAFTVLLPLALGVGAHHLWPRFAEKASSLLKVLATALLFLALVPMMIGYWQIMLELVGDGTVLAIILMVLAALAGGHLLGGPEFTDRAALAVTAATRHPGIALMIASANVADKRVAAAIIMVMIVGLIASIPYKIWVKRRENADPANRPHITAKPH